jgi:ribose transport system substrate-binding protein
MVSSSPRGRRLTGAVGATVACVVLSACGGSSGSDARSSAARGTVAVKTLASGCGSLPIPAVKDPDGVVAELPKQQRDAFGGYSVAVRKSPWATWKPKHPPPYTVGIAWQPLVSDFQVKNLRAIQAGLKRDPDIGKVITLSTGQDFNVPAQISQVDGFIKKGLDIVIVQALAPDALVTQARKASEAGIPMIEVQGTIPEVHSVNIQSNNYLSAGESAAAMMQIIGGKGAVLLGHGIQGLFTDAESFRGFKAAMDRCPGVKSAGEITGLFQPATAKGETLKFLATHPQPVAGALQIGAMSTGIMQAFQQSGRKMPVVADIAALQGSLGYWINNRSTYHGVGTGLGPTWLGDAAANVARRMLHGQGLKTTDIMDRLPLISDRNVAQWAKPQWSLATPGEADGPRGTFLTDSYLDPFFANGAALD